MQVAAGFRDDKLAYSPAEVMALLGIGRNAVYTLISSGELRARRVGVRRWLIAKGELDRWLSQASAVLDADDPLSPTVDSGARGGEMKIYIAAPFTASDTDERHMSKYGNIRRAADAGSKIIEKGHCPFVPHLYAYCEFGLTKKVPYERWMEIDNAFLESCDALLYLAPSPGADRELARAKELGLTVYYSVDEVPDAIQCSA